MKKFDNKAVEMIPIRLIISLVIIAAISLLLFFGYLYIRVTLAENNVANEIRTIESKLQTMIAGGNARNLLDSNAAEGTKRSYSFELPDNIIFLSFGVNPDENNDGVLKTNLTQNGSCIFYQIEGSSKKVKWLDDEIRFREGNYENGKWDINGNGQGYIISGGGGVTITFELVMKSNIKYILIQSTDNFLP